MSGVEEAKCPPEPTRTHQNPPDNEPPPTGSSSGSLGDDGEPKRDPTPEDDPILNNPYDEPSRYWELDRKGRPTGKLMKGRRPSAPYPTVPRSGSSILEPTATEKALHRRINEMRKHVESWSRAGYPGLGGNISRLLEYWSNKEQHGTRPYFCQVEAIKTLVWLCDADESVDPMLPGMRTEIREACENHNGDIMRYATKMATGTGKTMVMGMIIAWQALRERGGADILILVPNLTVRDRLETLLPQNSDNIYGQILPRGVRLPDQTHVSIVNYQAFQQRSTIGVLPGETADGKTRRVLTAGRPEPEGWKESPKAMLGRVLRDHRDARRITVINDEAHHCYHPDPKARMDASKGANPREAALWFSTLQHLRTEGRLGAVFDMSATPMFISAKADAGSELFPWIVSDYPLIDAIEAGLTKIPRVPVSDITGNDEPKYRNIFRYIRKEERESITTECTPMSKIYCKDWKKSTRKSGRGTIATARFR